MKEKGGLLRLFFAVPIPRDLTSGIIPLQDRLPRETPVRWVKPHGYHLTLRFLGEVDPGLLDPLAETLERAVGLSEAFALRLSVLGCFPHARRARVLWIGATKGVEPMGALASNLNAELVPLGFPPERKRFKPHLTMGRLKRPARVAEWPGEVGPYDLEVRRAVLYKSTLHPTGATYEEMSSTTLAGASFQDG